MITSTRDQKKKRGGDGQVFLLCVFFAALLPGDIANWTVCRYTQMTELEDAWELALAEASRRAVASGRADIAQYLDLRRQNDLLRRTAIDWLNAVFTSLAGDANRVRGGIQIERHDDHRFRRGPDTMVGTRLVLRRGVRALTVESGWPRTPRDGIVRGDGLACANIKHLGRARMNAELVLVRSRTDSPQWWVLKDDERWPLTDSVLRRHFSILSES